MRPTPCGCTSARFSGFTGTAVFNSNTVTVAPRAYFFWLVRKSRQKETLETNRIVPQATEEPCRRTLRQHTEISLQSYTTAPPAWRQRSHREQLLRKGMEKHAAVECRAHLRICR